MKKVKMRDINIAMSANGTKFGNKKYKIKKNYNRKKFKQELSNY